MNTQQNTVANSSYKSMPEWKQTSIKRGNTEILIEVLAEELENEIKCNRVSVINLLADVINNDMFKNAALTKACDVDFKQLEIDCENSTNRLIVACLNGQCVFEQEEFNRLIGRLCEAFAWESLVTGKDVLQVINF